MFKSLLTNKEKSLFTITDEKTIRDALIKINLNLQKCIIVVDKLNRLKGAISDGNIRRALLKGLTLESSIKTIYNKKNVIYFKETNFSLHDAKKKLIKNYHNTYIGIIPIVDNKKIVKDFFTIKSSYLTNDYLKIKKSTEVVVMAGGKGLRLKPFTEIFPKPLMPIGNKTAIDHIIDNFTENGFNNFTFSLEYKSKLLKAYLEEKKENNKINIRYIEEKIPLGTAGSLKTINKKIIKNDFFVINCDTILKLDFQNILNYHKSQKNQITIVVSMKNIAIPYGVCILKKNGTLDEIKEKPIKSYLVNTGLYIINPNIVKIIPKNKKFDFNELIKEAKNKKKRVGFFPIEDDKWNDVGSWDKINKLSFKNDELI